MYKKVEKKSKTDMNIIKVSTLSVLTERLENSLSISEENPEERPEAPSPDLPDSPL